MAMPNLMIGEVEPGTGADTNSGWYCTLKQDNSTILTGGTDWTQQAAAQVTFNGSTVTATIAATGATITLTGYTVLSTDVANTLRIASGTGSWTTGLFQIISVSTGSNTWTLDRNVATGASSAMVGTMGGALATLKQAFADMAASIVVTSGSVNDCTIWYKSGTDTITAGLTIPAQFGLIVQGYQTTRGDNTGTKPLLTTATNSVNMITSVGSSATATAVFNNINFSNTASTRGVGIYAPTVTNGRNITLINCKLSGFSYGLFGNSNNNSASVLFLYNCEITSSVNDGVNNSFSTWIYGCYIHGNGANGIYMSNLQPLGMLVVANSIIASNTTNGLNTSLENAPCQIAIQNSVFYNNTDAGIVVDGANVGWFLVNNIFQSNGTYGINNTGNSVHFYNLGSFTRLNNFFYSNGTAATIALPTEASDITGSASAFVTAGSNFALNTTAGGGAACSAAGFPGILPGSIGTGYISIGALEPNPSGGGGGGGLLVNPGMSGGIRG